MMIGIELGGWDLDSTSEDRFGDLVTIAVAATAAGFRLLAMPHQSWVGRSATLQPLETIAALAQTCDAMMLTGPLLVAVGHPVDIGEQIATAQHAAGGRLIVEVETVGAPADLTAFAIDPLEVRARTKESIAVWRKIWFDDFVDHRGTFYRVPDAQPTLRLYAGAAPAIAVSVHAVEDLEMAKELDAGLSMSTESTLEAPARVAAVSAARSRKVPAIVRMPISTPELLDEQIPLYAGAGLDHLVLQPKASTLSGVAELVRACAERLDRDR
jgi:alkanesulfonate monooxygenase SsuD/methylene tetrahydromethanopterin reductase-like flavin-dependent oxidoreductase (luciferase family)